MNDEYGLSEPGKEYDCPDKANAHNDRNTRGNRNMLGNRDMCSNAPDSAGETMSDADPPILPRPRMPLAQRAKIFIPFDPLKGYQEALREKEREAEARMNERITLEDPA